MQEKTAEDASLKNILELANEKLTFGSDLNPNSNHEYIKTLNNSFLNVNLEDVKKFKDQVDACIESDLDILIQKTGNSNQEKTKKKFG